MRPRFGGVSVWPDSVLSGFQSFKSVILQFVREERKDTTKNDSKRHGTKGRWVQKMGRIKQAVGVAAEDDMLEGIRKSWVGVSCLWLQEEITPDP